MENKAGGLRVAIGLKSKINRREAGLPDDGARRADGQFLFRMRDDGRVSVGVAVFGVAALLRDKNKSVRLKHTDDITGAEPFRH